MLLLQLVILVPAVQHKLKTMAVSTLQEQLNSDVSIGNFRLGFPKKLKVSDIFVSQNKSDTLLYVGEFAINLKLSPLFNHKIVAQKIELKKVTGDIGRLLEQLPADSTIVDEAPDSKSVSWEFAVNRLLVESSYIEYRDEDIGFNLIMDIGSLNLHLGNLDSDTLISCKLIEISETNVSYESLPIIDDEDTTAFEFADIRMKVAHLENSEFTYIDSAGAILFFAEGYKVKASDILVDITNEKVVINEGFAQNTSCAVEFLPENDTTPETYDYLNWGQYLWRVEGNLLELEGFKLTVDYQEEPDPKGHFNYQHMNIYDVNGKLTDFILDEDFLVAKMQNLSAKEINGLNILNLNATMDQDGQNFAISEMNIKTPNSEYLAKLKTNVSPTNYLEFDGKSIDLNLKIKSTNWQEIDYFYPLFNSFDFLSEDFGESNFELQTQINGDLNNLTIEQFNFSYLDSTKFIATANIKNLSNPDSLQINLDIEKLMSSKHNVESSVSKTILDSSYTFPGYVIVTGNYKGSLTGHHFSGNINSDVANFNISAVDVQMGDIPKYNVDLTASFKNISTLTNMDIDEGAFSLKGEFIGNSLYRANGNIVLDVDSLKYKNYYYKNLNVSGEMADGEFETKLNSPDNNLHFSIYANGSLFEDKQDIHLDVDIVNVNLKAINLHKEEFTIQGKASFAVAVEDENSYDISAQINTMDFRYVDTVYEMHPINVHFLTNNSQTLFKLESFYYNANFKAGDYIFDVLESLTSLPGYYLANADQDSVNYSMPEFQFTGQLEYPEAFARLFFPGFPAFENLTIDGSYIKMKDKLDFSLTIPGVKFNTIKSDSFNLVIEGTSKKLKYKCSSNLNIDDLLIGKLNLNGNFQNSKLISTINYFDSYKREYLSITTQVNTVDNSTVVRLIHDSLIFSYDSWVIDTGNQITFKDSEISIDNFELSSNGQKISIYSPFPKEPGILDLKIEGFHLGSLEYLFALDTIIAGDADADIRFSNLIGEQGVSGHLTISDMLFLDFELGKLEVTGFSFLDNLYEMDISMNGEYEDISLKGKIDFENASNPLSIDLNINRLDLDELNYLLSEYVDDAKGNLMASFQLSGLLENPLVNGNLNFENAGAHIKAMDNYFMLGTESITINNNILGFDNFSISNKQNQSAKIDGSIAFAGNNQTYSDLRVKTDKMEILNNTSKDSNLLFGLLKASADIDIKGTPSSLKLNADLKIDKRTNITYIFPDNLSVNDNSGVVKFLKYMPDTLKPMDIKESNPVFSMEAIKKINAGINIEKGAKFKLFFDSSGDNYLDASIDGDMNYNVRDENSEISGMFRVEEGKLHYSIPMVTVEDFTIEPGSFITMTNDMYNPHLNIVASAGIRASTESLMTDYKKVMTFKVLLYLIGDLKDIKLRFDISTQTNDAIVSAKLAQLTDSERNINALNLLVRGSFVISVHGSGAGSTSMVGAQIDKFYANQLNRLISDNIGFVDLHFDVQSYGDYGKSGEEVFRRNYYYNVGKSFLHNRARINYKGSLGVSSNLQSDEINSSFVQSQLEVEYLITKDGIFRGLLFRKDQYEGILEGEVVETGGGIRIKKNFYSIKDIFTNVEGGKSKKKDK